MVRKWIFAAVFVALSVTCFSQKVSIVFMDTLRYQVFDSAETALIYDKYWTDPGVFKMNLNDAIYYPYFIVATKDSRVKVYPDNLVFSEYFWE